MVFNVVYTLSFAVTIVCLGRGLLWWWKSLRERRSPYTPVGRPGLLVPASSSAG